MASWRAEHGHTYDIPDEIMTLVRANVIQDLSWKNDTCPKFGKEGSEIYLWVEHPDEEKRELGGRRFCVSNGEKTVIQTEEIDKAISFLFMELAEHGIPIGVKPKKLSDEKRKEFVEWMNKNEGLGWPSHSDYAKRTYGVDISPDDCCKLFMEAMFS